ncbi:MAG: class I SAM-dependent methyltransferase [Anaerolineae bacterium]
MSNVWSAPHEQSVTEQVELARFLQERSARPDQQAVNQALRHVMDVRPGERWLEIGCGPGILCQLIAEDVGPAGRVVGVDLSAEAARMAREANRQRDEAVNFVAAAGERLPLCDALFDGVLIARTLLHASDPDGVVREAMRVLRRGGRAVLMDWDFDTVVVDHTARDLTRKIIHWRTDHRGGNNWSGRQLYRRLVDAGARDISVTGYVSVVTEEHTSLYASLLRAAEGARDAGVISDAECARWIAEIEERVRESRFMASIAYFIASGQRP